LRGENIDGSEFMPAKKSVLAQQASELGDAVTRLFTGEPPKPEAKPRRKAAKRKSARREVKAATKRLVKKAKRAVSKRKARKR
jgi:hypothetical protein